MFEGFTSHDVTVPGGHVHVRMAGSGPPVLLLHGYPQTHAIWHRTAPAIAGAGWQVICADLPGYGRSSIPPLEDVEHYTKRAMANALVQAMEALGHARFRVVGHDRGARVAYRMTLDHPGRIAQLATLDVQPTLETFEKLGRAGGLAAYHWFFLAQKHPLPERLIGADPEWFLRWTLDSWVGSGSAFDEEAFADYRASFLQPDRLRASCNDYRAGATLDCEHDRLDRDAGRKIGCPMLALWGAGAGCAASDGPVLQTWRRWATNVRGAGLPCGHFIPEEAPEALLAALLPFLRAG